MTKIFLLKIKLERMFKKKIDNDEKLIKTNKASMF